MPRPRVKITYKGVVRHLKADNLASALQLSMGYGILSQPVETEITLKEVTCHAEVHSYLTYELHQGIRVFYDFDDSIVGQYRRLETRFDMKAKTYFIVFKNKSHLF